MTPALLIVTGAPASGKTTLARRLARDLSLPLFTKDDLKERLYDSLGVGDLDYSQRLGVASFELLYQVAGACLAVGQSVAIESNFRAERSSQELRTLAQRYPYRPVQVLCWADARVLQDRFRRRSEAKERHPGHLDDRATDEEMASILNGGRYQPLEIGGTLIEVETTDFATVVYEEILGRIRAAM